MFWNEVVVLDLGVEMYWDVLVGGGECLVVDVEEDVEEW